MKKKIFVTGLILMLAGCNTVAGLGEDVAGGARAVQRAL